MSDRTATARADRPPAKTFPLSVASGDPFPEGAILWTRIDPEVYGEDVPL